MNTMPRQDVKSLRKRVRAKLSLLRRVVRFSKVALGKYPRECPICSYQGLFRYFGDPPRADAQCPECSSLERHRLLKLWVDRSNGAVRGGRAIHFAPEPAVVGFLSRLADEYVTSDFTPGKADVCRNIEDIAEPDGSFDLIVCSHVLEHVNDRKALSELRRILRPNGTAILMVPIVEGWDATYEDPTVSSPAGRDLHFGQSDHIRFYGRDFRDRVRDAGFEVTEFTAEEPDVSKYGLSRGEKVFCARRP